MHAHKCNEGSWIGDLLASLARKTLHLDAIRTNSLAKNAVVTARQARS